MKTYEGNYNYKVRAEESLAGFAVEFYDRFWKALPIDVKSKLMGSYHEINRALGESMKNRVQILGARYEVDQQMINLFGEEKADQEAAHRLSRLLVEELLKSGAVSIQKGRHWDRPVTQYDVSIPFIILNEAVK